VQILLIDDDDAVRGALARTMEQAGWTVTAVADGGAALAALKAGTFDAIVCDLILPEREGTSLYEEIRETFPHMSERVVFVTGWSRDSNARTLLAHTGRPVLPKPVEPELLLRTVRGLTGAAS
jgi:two-component system NtrC family sensor kinase